MLELFYRSFAGAIWRSSSGAQRLSRLHDSVHRHPIPVSSSGCCVPATTPGSQRNKWTYSLPILCLGIARVCMAWCVHGVGIKNRDHLVETKIAVSRWCCVVHSSCSIVLREKVAALCGSWLVVCMPEGVVLGAGCAQGRVGQDRRARRAPAANCAREAGLVAWRCVCAGLCACASRQPCAWAWSVPAAARSPNGSVCLLPA